MDSMLISHIVYQTNNTNGGCGVVSNPLGGCPRKPQLSG